MKTKNESVKQLHPCLISDNLFEFIEDIRSSFDTYDNNLNTMRNSLFIVQNHTLRVQSQFMNDKERNETADAFYALSDMIDKLERIIKEDRVFFDQVKG